VWSPDGTQIAFLTTREGGRAVYVMNADGSDPQRLVAETADHMQPAWSPDGLWILFTQGVGTQAELMLLRMGEEIPFNLSNSPRDEVQAAWQPRK
jgi:TolB protein